MWFWWSFRVPPSNATIQGFGGNEPFTNVVCGKLLQTQVILFRLSVPSEILSRPYIFQKSSDFPDLSMIGQLATDKRGRIFETLAFRAMTLTRISAHVVRNQESGKWCNLRSLSSCSGCSTGGCKKSRELNALNPICGLDHG